MDLALAPTPLEAPIATARRPFIFYLVWAYVLSIPVENQLLIPGIGLVGRLFGIVVAAVWVLHALASGRVRRLERFHVAMLAFVMWSFASMFWSSDQSVTAQYVLTMAQLFVLALVVWDVSVAFDRIAALLQAFVLGASIGVLQVVSVVLRSGVAGFFRSRATLAGFNPNDVALIFALALPMAWFLASQSRSRRVKAWNYAYVAGACVAIPLTGSRAGVAAALAFLVMCCIRSTSQNSIRLVGWVFLGLVLFVGMSRALPQFTLERLQQGVSLVESGDLSGRGAIWSEAIHVWWEHPIAGVGAGSFPVVDPLFRSCQRSAYGLLQGAKESCTGAAAHDVFLTDLAELGIVGLLLFGWLVAIVVRAIPGQPFGRSWLWAECFLVWLLGALLNPWELDKKSWLLFVLIVAGRSLVSSARAPDALPSSRAG